MAGYLPKDESGWLQHCQHLRPLVCATILLLPNIMAIKTLYYRGVISPSRDVIDMDGYRDVKPVFEAAKAAGIFLIYRPG